MSAPTSPQISDPVAKALGTLTNPKLKAAVRLAYDAGWRIEPTKKGLMLFPPDGCTRPIAVHRSNRSKGRRGRINPLVQLRRAGLAV
jgi:hypothetical protein